MPSGPESLISTSPICQTAPSRSSTTPGTSALAVVLTPQVLPSAGSVADRARQADVGRERARTRVAKGGGGVGGADHHAREAERAGADPDGRGGRRRVGAGGEVERAAVPGERVVGLARLERWHERDAQ